MSKNSNYISWTTSYPSTSPSNPNHTLTADTLLSTSRTPNPEIFTKLVSETGYSTTQSTESSTHTSIRDSFMNSYSCRVGRGTHKALNQFTKYSRKVSKNNTKQCWILKCDIKKFFASIDHQILLNTMIYHSVDQDTVWLLSQIINSFHTRVRHGVLSNTGLPLGNLTSQLLVNIYMNKFDQYVKHKLKVKYYIRYADDFVFLSQKKLHLTHMRDSVNVYLREKLKLELHPNKASIKTLSSGIDFLGWVHFSPHRVLRTITKRRMMNNLGDNSSEETRASYFGVIEVGEYS